ncbi:MAG: 2-dehydro-3-deoxyphosphogluconate aldolase / (4S)-4-hydroxy-2-oxoglutarate aldolase [Thermotogota bacterium]|nr:2-dehydro-3-deoxyphosphogluconate aldolase / (4S)-4-hydroxy-2-oxoglutarate aldolase [Thermotogota bacterium]MDK2863941.1 2-dehydro-3-deoxyphosphogluconate aldolase / (4S)-4-hydroxy-2-oxoglutarate aldolase [Thermotogota bacterium]HCZ05811.1 2-dehydro-3-deoxyphosphogluconate aldolase [Thermotogota bacterium]
MDPLNLMKKEKIVAVLRGKSYEEAVEKVEALYRGGIKIIEITFTVPEADKVIESLSNKWEDVLIGAGTVLDVGMCRKAIGSGARFVVSPHVDEEISRECEEEGVPYFPGVMTPTEVVKALKMGRKMLKLFPGSALGPSYVKALKGPFPDVEFMPTGGVSLENVCEWLKAGCFAVGVGSQLVKGSPNEVEENARRFLEKIGVCG